MVKINIDRQTHIKEMIRFYNPLPLLYQIRIKLERQAVLRKLAQRFIVSSHNNRLRCTRKYSIYRTGLRSSRSDLAIDFEAYRVNKISPNPLNWILVNGSSSGTTGQPVKLDRTLRDLSFEEGFQRYWRKSIGWNHFDRVAVLRGNTFKEFDRGELFYELSFAPRLYLNSYALSQDNYDLYFDKLKEFKPKVLYCYPTTAVSLAKLIKWQQLESIDIPLIIYSSERLLEQDRVILEKVFSAKVYGWYGNGERTTAAGQCKLGHFHFFWNYAITQFDKDNKIISTPTRFSSFKILNYDTGDSARGILLDGCPCYSLEPSCSEILGRDTEYLFKKDGTQVSFHLTQIIRDEESVLNGQLVQNVDGKVVIRVEPLQSEITLNRILNSFHRRLPDIEVEVVDCEKIERTPTGKFVSFLNNYQNSEGQTN